jgi:O-antigen/teichoic acid export membrane protein
MQPDAEPPSGAAHARAGYAALMIAAAGAAVVKSLVFAFWLDPAAFGLYSLAMLVAAFGNYAATWGLADGLAREVPILLGRRDHARAQIIRSGGITLAALLAAACGVGVMAAGYGLARVRPEYDGVAWAGPVLAATVIFNVVLGDLRARQHTIPYGALLLAKSTLALAAARLLPTGLTGALTAEVLSLVLAAGAAMAFWRGGLTWVRPRWTDMRPLFRMGLPFTAGNAVQSLTLTLDRWFVQARFGSVALGRYSLVMLVLSFALVVLNIVQQWATPRILHDFGRTGDRAGVRRAVRRLAGAIGAVLAVAAVPAYAAFVFVIGRWYPEYAGAETLFPLVYLGAAVMALGLFDVLFLAAGSGARLLGVHLVTLAVVAAGCLAGSAAGAPMLWYAGVFAAGRLVTVAAGFWMGSRALSASAASTLRYTS